MVALIENKQPILGVIYMPTIDKLYFAEKGKGTYMQIGNERPQQQLQVSNTDNLNDFTVVRSRNHFSSNDQKIADILKIEKYQKCGSAGVKFGAIAEGNAELCYYTTDKMGIWDDCPSHIILKEAGGDVFTIDGLEPSYDLKNKKMLKGFIGTNGTNKKEILNAISKAKLNIRKEITHITKQHRREKNKHHSAVLWFTGLSGSGKSTLAKEVEKKLFEMNLNSYILDGDNLRFGLNKDLDFSGASREENIRRVAEVSRLFVDSGHFVMSAFISPYNKDREFAREILENDEFIEIYVKCPIEVCEQRDVKGLYKKARGGLIKGFTGINDPYEEPTNSDIIIDTSKNTIEESVEKIIEYLKKIKFI